MHDAAIEWVAAHWEPADVVVDVGGRNVNYGTARHLWPKAHYTAIDLIPGEGVDWVGDFLDYESTVLVDLVVCMEVLEHCDYWRGLIKKAWSVLRPGGWLLLTAAGPDRLPHSGVDGGPLRPGEWYSNIDPVILRSVLEESFTDITLGWGPGDTRALAPGSVITQSRGDVYAKAQK
jgi:SAM-dependent methyltransferase